MSKFKTGDIIRCVSVSRNYSNKPKIGKLYKIISVGYNKMLPLYLCEFINEYNIETFCSKDFELVKLATKLYNKTILEKTNNE